MRPDAQFDGPPRSAAGFALAVICAAITIWLAGLLAELGPLMPTPKLANAASVQLCETDSDARCIESAP